MKKKKSKGGQKLRLWVPPCVFIYENAIALWVMETENSLWLFSVSITQKSENWMMETELSFGQTTFLLWVPPFLSYELWKLRIELSNLVGQTTSKILGGHGQRGSATVNVCLWFICFNVYLCIFSCLNIDESRKKYLT